MRPPIVTTFASALLACGGIGATFAAHAAPDVHVHVDIQAPAPVRVHPRPQPVYAPPPPAVIQVPVQVVHEAPAAHVRHRRNARHAGESGCAAPRWHPGVRYMPGQVVWRKGGLFVARPVSARVWNENSPPEWTPRYWAEAACM